jgi:hypothetical protein
MLHKFRRKEDLRAGGRINIGLSLIPDSRCFGGMSTPKPVAEKNLRLTDPEGTASVGLATMRIESAYEMLSFPINRTTSVGDTSYRECSSSCSSRSRKYSAAR